MISYAQNFEDVMLWRALKGVDKGFFIDVGAQSPEADSVTKFFYDSGWSGINIEPNGEYFEKLKSARPRDVNLQLALGDQSGSARIFLFSNTGLSTLSEEQAHIHRANGREFKIETIDVETLSSICEKYAHDTIHFLKIDVEGHEAAVLAGADFKRYRPWIVVVEAKKPASEIETSSEWEPRLLEAGYEFVWFDGLNRFYSAAERAARLRPAFAAPPNVFDQFVKHRPVASASIENKHIQWAIESIYRVLLMRHPDPVGMSKWMAQVKKSGNLDKFVESVLRSPEFRRKFETFTETYIRREEK